jgi:hypothetical protein
MRRQLGLAIRQSQTDQPPDVTAGLPFPLLRLRLLKHKPQTQVLQCEYTQDQAATDKPCIVKLFSPRAQVAFESELCVYSLEETPSERASKLWPGSWTTAQYRSFLAGNFPMLRRPVNQVQVLVLSFIANSIPLSDINGSSRVGVSKAALKALHKLHNFGHCTRRSLCGQPLDRAERPSNSNLGRFIVLGANAISSDRHLL